MQSHRFCVCVHVIVYPELHAWSGLPELVVVGDCFLCIYHHVQGHQPYSWCCHQIKVHLCFVYSQLIALHGLGQVWLPDSILQQHEKLALRFFCSATITENAVAHVNLCPENEVQESLD